jgi:hypothetical protein
MEATTLTTGWEARPLAWPARAVPGGRWGIEHRPTGRRVAFGSEARCRALVAPLAEVDAVLSRAGAPPPVPSVVPLERATRRRVVTPLVGRTGQAGALAAAPGLIGLRRGT